MVVMSKFSPTEIAARIGAIAKVADQSHLRDQRIRELHVDFIRHVANTEAVSMTIRKKARIVLDTENFQSVDG
jgi:hypothetical protein